MNGLKQESKVSIVDVNNVLLSDMNITLFSRCTKYIINKKSSGDR